MTGKKVLLGLSGGVDSAVAAYLLQQAGYTLHTVTMHLHGYGAEDIDRAAQIAVQLGVPHTVLDLSETFAACVVRPFVQAYCDGGTPNPCIICNRFIKFGALLDWALENGYDYIASGHYARIEEENGIYRLRRGADEKKDQSYFLYTLTQKQLSHTLFPLGAMTKEQVRNLAEEQGLLSAKRRDSQDVCFIPDGDYVRFLCEEAQVRMQQGCFRTADDTILGRHTGMERYTIGQRKGLGISAAHPLYVLHKDRKSGDVILGEDAALYRKELYAADVCWVSAAPEEAVAVRAKIRYRHADSAATVYPLPDGRVRVVFEEAQRAVTPGQSVVFYDGEYLLGGAVIGWE